MVEVVSWLLLLKTQLVKSRSGLTQIVILLTPLKRLVIMTFLGHFFARSRQEISVSHENVKFLSGITSPPTSFFFFGAGHLSNKLNYKLRTSDPPKKTRGWLLSIYLIGEGVLP